MARVYTFLGKLKEQAPIITQPILDGYFETIRARLRQNILNQDYVPEGEIFSDFKMRVLNQILSFNYENANYIATDHEVPDREDILLAWINELRVFAETQLLDGNNVETNLIQEELKNLLTPTMEEVWQGCYHCNSIFKREDQLAPCPHCNGWLCVELSEADPHKFLYTYEEVVSWEFRRLNGSKKASGLRNFELFNMVNNEEGDACPICLEIDDHNHDGWKRTYCNHTVGFGCLRKWLQKYLICPICRKEFPGDNDGPLAEVFNRSRRVRLGLED